MPVANELHDLLASWESAPLPTLSGGLSPGGWPVEPGDIVVLDPAGTVAVCTLGDAELAAAVAAAVRAAPAERREPSDGDPEECELSPTARPSVAVAGPMATENIGLEKLVRNVLGSQAVEDVVLCGSETGGTAPTGHYAGDALLCLLRHGVEPETRRIVGARGRRPYVRNLLPEEIAAFRRRVRLLDLRGEADPSVVLAALADMSSAWHAGAVSMELEPVGSRSAAGPVLVEEAERRRGYVTDPAGYVIVFADANRCRLVLEHYSLEGRRTAVLTGRDPLSLASAAIERGLVSRLDHAAYLGRELQRALSALEAGAPYVQDAAPEAGG